MPFINGVKNDKIRNPSLQTRGSGAEKTAKKLKYEKA